MSKKFLYVTAIIENLWSALGVQRVAITSREEKEILNFKGPSIYYHLFIFLGNNKGLVYTSPS